MKTHSKIRDLSTWLISRFKPLKLMKEERNIRKRWTLVDTYEMSHQSLIKVRNLNFGNPQLAKIGNYEKLSLGQLQTN